MGLVIQNDLHSLLCEWCQCLVSPDTIQGHIKDSHPDFKARVNLKDLSGLLAEKGICDSFPTCGGDPSFPGFEGLRTHQGLRCGLCPKVLTVSSSMKKHHFKFHNDHPLPKTWDSCYMQRFTNRPGPSSTFFEVQEPSPREATLPSAIKTSLRNEMSKITMVSVTPRNSRRISPWLLSTGWYDHIQDYETAELLSLVTVPKDAEFNGLKQLVLLYFKKATELIKSTGELPLQMLNTPYPLKR